jgi:glycosyltransferase involved in cell wall biosynthesis
VRLTRRRGADDADRGHGRLVVTLTLPHLETTNSPYRELSAIARHLPPDDFRLVVCHLRGPSEGPAADLVRGHGHELRKLRYRPRALTARDLATATRETVRHHLAVRADVHHALDYTPVPFEAAMARTFRRRFLFHQLDLSEDSSLRMLRAKIRLAHAAVALAPPVADHLRANGLPERKLHVIPNGLDLDEFDASVAALARPDFGGPYLVNCSHVQPRKRQEVAVRAFARLAGARPDLQLVLAGSTTYDPAYVEHVRTVAGELGVAERVHLLGTRTDVPALIAHAEASMLCSESDAFPWTVIESLAARTPVVATDTLGSRAIIDDAETGQLVPVGDDDALARAVTRALDDRPWAAELTTQGRHVVETRLSSRRMVDALADLYRQVARRPRAGARA